MENICEKCNKVFATKYTLKKHTETNKCLERIETHLKKCLSLKCDYQTQNKTDLQKHIKVCRFVEVDHILHKHKNEVDSILERHLREIEKMKNENEIEILRLKNEWMQKEKELLTSLVEKAVSKPLISHNTNTNTNTTIRGNNNNLQQILASNEIYQKQVDPERIMNIDRKIIEKHFWLGQRGMAKMCIDHIIKTQDSDGNNKLLLCCTDPSRKRFKYIDATNNIIEDIDARHFINIVSIPIKTVCRDVYDDIIKKIEDDKKDTTNGFDLNMLETKTSVAQQKFLEINDIADHNRNSEYKNEMSILLNT
jgi:hypothetical protein